MRVRARLTLRNDVAIAARTKLGLNQREVAERSGVRQQDVCSIETLRFDRVTERKILAVSVFLGVPPDDLVPPELCRKSIASKHEVVQDIPTIALLEATKHPIMLAAPADAPIEAAEMEDAINRAMSTLNHRERQVLRLRVGLGGLGEHSLAEVAEQTGLSMARVHTIGATAMRKLQHPHRRAMLRPFVPAAEDDAR